MIIFVRLDYIADNQVELIILLKDQNLGTSLLPARSLAVGLFVVVCCDFLAVVLLKVGTLEIKNEMRVL